MGRFIIKHIQGNKPQKPIRASYPSENKINENKSVMTTEEKIAMAQNVLNGSEPSAPIKRVKKDKGLIERTESSKTILTEDNKELLND
jgi:hypothetical protein